MVKFLLTILSGMVVGFACAYFSFSLADEKLVYEMSEAAKFGDITYQNVKITNAGWSPATNVKVFLQGRGIDASSIQATPVFSVKPDQLDQIGGYDRIRRDETVTISFSLHGDSINPANLKIESDRTLAKQIDSSTWSISARALFLSLGVYFLVTIIIGILSSAYKDYKKEQKKCVPKE